MQTHRLERPWQGLVIVFNLGIIIYEATPGRFTETLLEFVLKHDMHTSKTKNPEC